MITCNELRIGNYVLLNNQMQQVSMLHAAHNGNGAAAVGYEQAGDQATHTCTPSQLQPVPLTDALLQQAGFRYHPYFQFWQKIEPKNGELSEMDLDRDFNVLDFMRRPIVKGVTSLHQLQNVYYLLKGRELEINWKK